MLAFFELAVGALKENIISSAWSKELDTTWVTADDSGFNHAARTVAPVYRFFVVRPSARFSISCLSSASSFLKSAISPG